MNTPADAQRQLEELRAENDRLRRQVAGQSANHARETTTRVDLWKGHPVLRFDGNFRPFSIGLKKASIILQKLDDVRFFVENNRSRIAQAPDEDGAA